MKLEDYKVLSAYEQEMVGLMQQMIPALNRIAEALEALVAEDQ